MTHEHIFVRETPPLEASDLCPDCREPWQYCSCELPDFETVLETYERSH